MHTLIHRTHGEVFILRFTDATRCEAMRTLGRLACDPALAFTWMDAAVVSRRMRECVKENV